MRSYCECGRCLVVAVNHNRSRNSSKQRWRKRPGHDLCGQCTRGLLASIKPKREKGGDPDDDFIDLSALASNVKYMIMREAITTGG